MTSKKKPVPAYSIETIPAYRVDLQKGYRSGRINVPLNADELKRVSGAASKAGLPLATFVRTLILEKC